MDWLITWYQSLQPPEWFALVAALCMAVACGLEWSWEKLAKTIGRETKKERFK